ncbi:Uncharacterized protein TCAP_06657 [Tolypocladium capitatum]|uniref:Acyl-CoA thioesterase-like C-terminal domain-containing protein n=1 Tax=Tolypocladium capitatum TaxID=45235 RepID=A0A2K3Q763_9HYPO|nr:Uncharacterized protein TCAP_06657 [Tolypocladium capitatum]
MAPAAQFPRRGFREAMAMTPLPAADDAQGRSFKRFISQQPAWTPGGELPWAALDSGFHGPRRKHSRGVYGGHIYAQASLAAARAVEEEDKHSESNGRPMGTLGIHSIHGVFTNPSFEDRPFIYQVSPLSSAKSFKARLVNARQPKQPSRSPLGPFPMSDADLPLSDTCFSCITTFKRSVPMLDDMQEAHSAQERYADILSSRAPDEWDLCPQADIDLIKELFPNPGPGAFPILDMHKVDMTAYNADKVIAQRRELSFYRLLKPLPKEDVNAHILCHAFEADRNGLIMLGNHMGYGYNLGRAATLTYSFYVHVNPDEAVMNADGWWLQEICWPRVSVGRCMMESKIWSPEGKHVASGYQDGIIEPREKKSEGGSKL